MKYTNTLKRFFIIVITCSAVCSVSCKKILDVGKPTKTITNEETYRTDESALSAMAGVYASMMYDSRLNFGNGATTLYAGLSADEFTTRDVTGSLLSFQRNDLYVDLAEPGLCFWVPAYKQIFYLNTIIEQAAASTSGTFTTPVRNQLTGESKFLRAFCYFYLTNFFGDVPLVLTTDFKVNALLPRKAQAEVYDQIEKDLKEAQTLLSSDYALANTDKTHANKYAATALLARVYLYRQKWKEAEEQASLLIDGGNFSLVDALDHVFDKTSQEAILQFATTTNYSDYRIPERRHFVPAIRWVDDIVNYGLESVYLDHPDDYTNFAELFYPSETLTKQMLSAFEKDDQRKAFWTSYIESPNVSPWYGAITYYIKKYHEVNTVGVEGEQEYTVMRLAEQYLIRAEARAHLGKLAAAATDLNVIRARAGLPSKSASNMADMLLAIEHERQVELFGEFGHRWFDLKRTNRAQSVLGAISIKSPFQSYQLLYPIPRPELLANPNLRQNPGYN
ncbi:RagB/SusD family nutrient uptake outer membrane protein [Mucilaginibacter conchicola]|uniref:RagB/SusD family nutrient uptake outer membrane protein n=1 Tax=Mucilaginibacter conchicola TaxID=2303333 RepID=A0A372NPY0_9SPHI|nr:RagB/SusD family nutrient uptake outer membrane protein [Mucilaginibacter conchicola]RFZ90928.1 RagB/SusD family nutrient uptake outer membrane protein [Mucilaginibacter conchicola]